MILEFLSGILRLIAFPLLRNFEKDLENPRASQERLLRQLLFQIEKTAHGKELGLSKKDDYLRFAEKVPLTDYRDYQDRILEMRAGKKNLLWPKPILTFEPTSGSSGAKKYIPYTQELRSSFSRMFLVWAADLIKNAPKLKYGRIFISISPASGEFQEGFEDDREYLSPLLRVLMKRLFVYSPHLKKMKNPENFWRGLACLLIAEKNLEVISIWSPTYWESLLEFIRSERYQLMAALKRGEIELEGKRITFKTVEPSRIAILKSDFIDWQKLWPDLKILSCWAHANSQLRTKSIQKLFPNLFIQPKGLLATEAPLSFPWILAQGFLPLLSEVFYEFENEGRISRIHELEIGKTYSLLLSQKSGLLRYRLGDRIRVTHFYKKTPAFEFVGRVDRVSDLVGEKLNQEFLESSVLSELPDIQFGVFLPLWPENQKPYYLFVTQSELPISIEKIERLVMKNFHYAHARKLGQLGPLQVAGRSDLTEIYQSFFEAKGIKRGDLKPQSLIPSLEISMDFFHKLKATSFEQRESDLIPQVVG